MATSINDHVVVYGAIEAEFQIHILANSSPFPPLRYLMQNHRFNNQGAILGPRHHNVNEGYCPLQHRPVILRC